MGPTGVIPPYLIALYNSTSNWCRGAPCNTLDIPWTMWGFYPWWMTWPPLKCSRWLDQGGRGCGWRTVLSASQISSLDDQCCFSLQNDVLNGGWAPTKKYDEICMFFFRDDEFWLSFWLSLFLMTNSLKSSLIVLSPWFGLYGELNLRVMLPQLCTFLVSAIYIYHI